MTARTELSEMPGLGIDPCEPLANDRLAGVLLAHLKLADVGEL